MAFDELEDTHLGYRLLWTIIITLTGGSIMLGAVAQLRGWTDPRVWHAKPEHRRSLLSDVFTMRGIFWSLVCLGSAASTVYMYTVVLITRQEHMLGAFTVALIVITLKRYFFVETPELVTKTRPQSDAHRRD